MINELDIKEDDIFQQFNEMKENISLIKSQLNLYEGKMKILEKNIKKKIKNLNKELIKSTHKNNTKIKILSGFAIPRKVSNELCYFMNKNEGTEMARTDVTRSIVCYIKENNLENHQNKKFILPDEKLKKLLGNTDEDTITYFNIQKFMNKHFISSELNL